jgi:tRNA threonylcarbamoyladenosine biosynthesis protein TsaB
MRILGIETATAAQSVAVLQDEHILAEASWSGLGTRGGNLLPMIDFVLQKARLSPGAVEAAAVSVGPGSFTGVRVGLATAKGMALGTNAVLLGVSTLETLAAGYEIRNGTVCAVLRAGRGEVYGALYNRRDSVLQQLCPEVVLSPEALAAYAMTLAADDEIQLIGDGVAQYRDRLETGFQGRARVTQEGLIAIPRATVVATLAFAQIQAATEEELRQKDVAPVYLRRAEAEMNWEKGLVKSPLERLALGKSARLGARGPREGRARKSEGAGG